MSRYKYKIVVWICALVVFTSCEKLLNEPSDKSLAIPTSLGDLQALLDRPDKSYTGFPGAGEASTDDNYITDARYLALSTMWDQRRYIWADTDVFSGSGNPWYTGYFAIYGSNAVLDFLSDMKDRETEVGRYIKGQALFWRAFHYFEMAQVFTLPYHEATAATELGLPLRLDVDFNAPSIRSSLQETYQQIFVDLKESVALLTTQPIHSTRASRQGAYGLLARAYLAVRDYEKAGLYADSCLRIHATLIDYNSLNAADTYPIKAYNSETITFAGDVDPLINPNIALINPNTYSLYKDDDLRKTLFFMSNPDGTIRFKGQYMGSAGVFTGISTGEALLIRAESYARKGEVELAMQDLNTLLKARWNKNSLFVPYSAGNDEEAKNLVLEERRRELIMRGLRWSDIRRLNLEGANISQTRTVNGVTYTLPPNDLRYALALPEDLIERSGIAQNRR